MTQSACVTYERFVLPDNKGVRFRTSEQEYQYTNGSVVALGGMDKVSKIMSSEYDIIYAMEATELTADDFEILTTRARFGIVPYNQVIACCNPSYPTHWLNQMVIGKRITNFMTFHEDNPVYYDHKTKQWTEKGEQYIAKLDALTGVRYLRLRRGVWVAAEGAIYPEYNYDTHQCEKFDPPRSWTRVWCVDFGFTRPIVIQMWAIDPDTGISYMYNEIYHTKMLVEDAAALITAWRMQKSEPLPTAIVCDHDAEDRATLERHIGMLTTNANKKIHDGIQVVKEKLKVGALGKPEIIFMRDALMEMDYDLVDAHLPYRSVDEFEGYVWSNRAKKEVPVDEDDHGMDTMRYFCTYLIDNSRSWTRGFGRRK